MIWYSSHPEPHRPTTTSHTSSPGADGTQMAALAVLAKHDANRATPTPHKLRVTRRAPPVSHAQLLA